MGRRLNLSTPTVINTELKPLDESFYIEASGQLEQWFYENTSQFAPDRSITPLRLTPRISVYDSDTRISYTPTFQLTRWFVKEWHANATLTYTFAVSASPSGNPPSDISTWSAIVPTATSSKPYKWVRCVITEGVVTLGTTYIHDDTATTTKYATHKGDYVETEVTDVADGNGINYVKDGNTLLVKKNVSYTNAVTIRCEASYIDPRDQGILSTVQDSVMLTCNRDATVVWPEVAITSPSGRTFNPLTDYTTVNGVETQTSEYAFEGTITNSPDVSGSEVAPAKYEADGWGTEDVALGEGCAPILDVRYPDGALSEDQEISYRPTADGSKLGSKGFAFIEKVKGNTVAWNQKFDYNVGYMAYRANVTTSGDILTVTITAVNSLQGIKFNDIPVIENHKYYLSVKANAPVPVRLRQRADADAVFNILLPTGGWARSSYIINYTSTEDLNLTFRSSNAEVGTAYQIDRRIQWLDLTLIYGSGNEPSTPEEFEADYVRWFGKPLTYEDYDAGSLRPVLMTGIKTTGFNQWDEQNVQAGAWAITGDVIDSSDYGTKAIRSTSYIRIFKNAKYYLHCKNGDMEKWYIAEYDGEKIFIVRRTLLKGAIYTPSSKASYFRFSTERSYGYNTYQHDICINMCYDNTRNGEYEAYKGNEAQIDVTTVKGKLNGTGSLVTVFPDGMKSAGSVHDEILMENGKLYAIKRVGSVDLGTLTWSKFQQGETIVYFQATNIPNDMPINNGSAIIPAKNVKYRQFLHSWYGYEFPDRGYVLYITNSLNLIRVKDSSYTDAATFKSAMSGVILYYELATPQRYELNPLQNPFIFEWFGIKDGVEVLADTLPWYKSGQHTNRMVVDAMYGENITAVLRAKNTLGIMSPSKAYASVAWRYPNIETFVQSHNGAAVRSDTRSMLFSTIMNLKSDTISEARKRAHLMLNWKYRKSNNTQELDAGWGQSITIEASKLRNVKYGQNVDSTLASTLVFPYIYLLGAYEGVTEDDEEITEDGEAVVDRAI